MNRILYVAGGLAAAAGVAFGLYSVGTAAPPVNGAALFSQSFSDSEGKAVSLTPLKGKIVVVNFWAPWCAPCVEEMPRLSKLAAEYKSHNVEFLGIGIDSAHNIADFQKKVQVTYPLVVGGAQGSDLVREFGDNAGALPYTFILDGSGNVRESKLGQITEKELRAWLKPLTASS